MNICVDLDGTLAVHKKYEFNKIGEPIKSVIDKVNELAMWKGYKIFIQTTRSWCEYDAVKSWLCENGVMHEQIAMGGKPVAQAYIDDRAVNPTDKDWKEKLNKILSNSFEYGIDKRKRKR